MRSVVCGLVRVRVCVAGWSVSRKSRVHALLYSREEYGTRFAIKIKIARCWLAGWLALSCGHFALRLVAFSFAAPSIRVVVVVVVAVSVVVYTSHRGAPEVNTKGKYLYICGNLSSGVLDCGLCWAIRQVRRAFTRVVHTFHTLSQYRIICGIFRHRRAVRVCFLSLNPRF